VPFYEVTVVTVHHPQELPDTFERRRRKAAFELGRGGDQLPSQIFKGICAGRGEMFHLASMVIHVELFASFYSDLFSDL
jgi:hypothetical protein